MKIKNLITHTPDKCSGHKCCIHNPSDHHMKNWPMSWRSDKGVMERICPHGVGHSDPDDVAYGERSGRDDALNIHGCDGCCSKNVKSVPPAKVRPLNNYYPMTTTVYITREIEITVEVEYISGQPATYLNPQEFPRVRILDAFDELDQGVRLTEVECDKVREMVIQDPPQRDCYDN